MPASPPLSHPRPDAIVAWRAGRPVTRRAFIAHARRVAEAFPPGGHLLNACEDRYRFAVTLVAAMLAGRVNLMPSSYTPEVVRRLAEFAPDAFLVADGAEAPAGMARFAFPDDLPAQQEGEDSLPQIAHEQLVAWVFTSGSTGTPVPHPKTWGKLVRNTRAAAAELGLAGGEPFTLLGTVPAQHMYGFESTVLLALMNGGAFVAERPFFPADVLAALDAMPRPRVLVTTPFHLRNMLETADTVPAADLVMSATAPLPPDLAKDAEAAFGAPLVEIYGSTETGQIATRRPTADARWRLFPGIRLERRGDATWAMGGHIEAPMPLGDAITIEDEGRFTLGARNTDLVNIAGKRTSLAYLDRQLAAIAGVIDGAFHLPEEGAGQVTRLAAFVVAPGLDRAAVLAALRERIDPLFLPRPLILLDALPRNATGKLPREACTALLAAHRTRR